MLKHQPTVEDFIGCITSKKNLYSMKKTDLLSLFFLDPMNPTNFDDFPSFSPSNTLIMDKEDSLINLDSNEDHTDPSDISMEGSMNDDIIDSSSNTTDCEPLWCDCTTSCFCEEEWWTSYSSVEPGDDYYDDDEKLSWNEIQSFEYADAWEEKRRKKEQRGSIQRAKRSEKKDKVWAHSYVKAIIQKKKETKESIIRDQVWFQSI